MYGSRNPAGVAAGQLGLITTGLAMGVVGCHERGIAAMRAARERRAENDTVVALAHAQRDVVELSALARKALDEVARLTAENARLRQACADRQHFIDRMANRSAA